MYMHNQLETGYPHIHGYVVFDLVLEKKHRFELQYNYTTTVSA